MSAIRSSLLLVLVLALAGGILWAAPVAAVRGAAPSMARPQAGVTTSNAVVGQPSGVPPLSVVARPVPFSPVHPSVTTPPIPVTDLFGNKVIAGPFVFFNGRFIPLADLSSIFPNMLNLPLTDPIAIAAGADLFSPGLPFNLLFPSIQTQTPIISPITGPIGSTPIGIGSPPFFINGQNTQSMLLPNGQMVQAPFVVNGQILTPPVFMGMAPPQSGFAARTR